MILGSFLALYKTPLRPITWTSSAPSISAKSWKIVLSSGLLLCNLTLISSRAVIAARALSITLSSKPFLPIWTTGGIVAPMNVNTVFVFLSLLLLLLESKALIADYNFITVFTAFFLQFCIKLHKAPNALESTKRLIIVKICHSY